MEARDTLERFVYESDIHCVAWLCAFRASGIWLLTLTVNPAWRCTYSQELLCSDLHECAKHQLRHLHDNTPMKTRNMLTSALSQCFVGPVPCH